MDLGKVVVGKLLMDLLMHIPWLLLLDQGQLLAMYLEQNLQLNRLVQVDHKGLNHHNHKHTQNNRLQQLLDRLSGGAALGTGSTYAIGAAFTRSTASPTAIGGSGSFSINYENSDSGSLYEGSRSLSYGYD